VLLPKMTPEEAALFREMLDDSVDEPASYSRRSTSTAR